METAQPLPDGKLSSTANGDALSELERLASEIGATEIVDDVRSLAARVAEGLFYVACVGQFKRGKSTLLNALIGTPLLPTGVLPVTAVITILRFGRDVRAIVHFSDRRQRIIEPSAVGEYITEEQNPENRKGVRIVEIFAPSDLLASGMCLVDTPGLGSIFRQNTETTRQFLPHIDAALIVLGADPPISNDEAAIAQEIARDAPYVLFVLNKADRMSNKEVAEAAAFARDAMRSRLGHNVELFIVSALEAAQKKMTRDWAVLTTALMTLSRDAGADLVRSAEERGERRIVQRLLREVTEQTEALSRPIAESEQRIASLRQTIDDARRALADLGYLFTAEQHRLSREFEEERTRFLEEQSGLALAQLEEAIARIQKGTALREEALHAAQRLAHDAIHHWMQQIEPRAEQLYSRATDRFVALAQDFLRRIAESGVSERAEELSIEQGFRKRRGFYFTSLWAVTGRPPGAGVLDFLRSSSQQRERARRDARQFLTRLLEANSARVANDLTERVLESRRALEREIRSILDRAMASAERALERARATQQRGRSDVEREIARLSAASERLQKLGT